VGLLGRASWGAWRLQAWLQQAKVPGPACAKIFLSWLLMLGRESFPRNALLETGPVVARRDQALSQRGRRETTVCANPCVSRYYGYQATLGWKQPDGIMERPAHGGDE
jgi:hypothetical protein